MPPHRDDEEASQPLQELSSDSSLLNNEKRRNLYLAAICANFSSMAAGCAMGWSSPSIIKLEKDNIINEIQGSWLTSLLAVGAVIGPFLAYRVVDRIGRKMTIILDMILFIISLALLGLAPTISSSLNNELFSLLNIMYLSRFMTGIAVGCTFMVTPIYIAEISDTHIRTALGSLMQLFIVLGLLLQYCVGPYYSSTVLTVCSTIPPVMCLIVFIFILPESPLFLLSHNRTSDAVMALKWLRQKHNVNEEIDELRKSLEESQLTATCSWSKLFTTRGHLICLFYGTSLMFFQQLSGINVVLFYSERIFEMTNSTLSSSLETIIVGVVFMFSSFWAPFLTKLFGMKFLLCGSSLCGFVFQGLLGVYFYLEQRVNMSAFNWVPVICLVLFITTYSVGLGPLPWAVMGEIYSPTIKSKSSAITSSVCWFYTFILTKYFTSVSNLLGPYICFWIFSTFCMLSFLFIKFKLPDTRGLSLQQIQSLMYS